MVEDAGEQVDVASAHPEVVARLRPVAEAAMAEAKEKMESPVRRTRPENLFFHGPGRITGETAMPIEDALRKTRGDRFAD